MINDERSLIKKIIEISKGDDSAGENPSEVQQAAIESRQTLFSLLKAKQIDALSGQAVLKSQRRMGINFLQDSLRGLDELLNAKNNEGSELEDRKKDLKNDINNIEKEITDTERHMKESVVYLEKIIERREVLNERREVINKLFQNLVIISKKAEENLKEKLLVSRMYNKINLLFIEEMITYVQYL